MATGRPAVGEGQADGQPLLAVDNVTLQYKTQDSLVTATWRVGFEVFASERFVLLGPSGCGKSTLLKAVAGFMAPVEGAIRLSGKSIDRPGSDRMMVFQEFDQLLPWKTVLGNVMFPLVVNRVMPRAGAQREKARHPPARATLPLWEPASPHLRPGEKKRGGAPARPLPGERRVFWREGPSAARAALTRRKMQEELVALWEDVRFTVL